MQIKAPCKEDSYWVCFLLKCQSFPLDKQYPFQSFSHDSKETPSRAELNVFICAFLAFRQLAMQVERSLDQMEEFYLQGGLYQIYNQIRRVSKSAIMNTHSMQTRSKPCLISSKTAFKPFIIQLSQSSYNQQILKRKATPNNKQIHIRQHHNSQYKENSPVLSVKENIEMEIKNFRPQFTINSIEGLILGPVSKEDRKKYVYNVYRGVIYSQLKLRQPSEDFVQSRSVFLSEPTGSHKKFLLLDLDETLIHTERSIQNNGKTSYRFVYRPHLFTFLERMGQFFEVYVFTAAQKSYAEAIVRKLNRKRVLVQDLLHRQHCFETRKGRFLKDLRIVGNRGLQDIVIVDNLVESFGLQLSNGVPILEFTGAADDAELLKIIPLMEEISRADDVRSVLKEKFRLEEVCGLDRKDVEAYFATAE